ncbi:glutamine amidotransferase [Magnetospirillum sp. UT-4]|uniref:glutamine amidotransferase n=1 Tax=Magnetospirillum sp. UT-4 TaxID=2681467 RepID=UPI00137E5B2C|nr:glutamine amidotransferase [Magnetospirillum sp. UT-4]CAA7624189.1 Glutamine amidotransferase class-I [Magnetospirillum sp. UT-4]
MKSCVAIRHVAFEDLDRLGPVLAELGFTVTMVEAATDDLARLDPLAPDLLVVLGGPIGAYDEADYPFLTAEIDLIRRRLGADRATLGICLGAQLMARALGARVYPNPNGKEIGWAALSLTPEGEASVLTELAGAPVLHWHGDTFDLPHGAVRLAETPATANQAFAWGMRALALQFHVEAGARGLERWFVGHAAEIAATPGVSVAELRAATAAVAPRMEPRGMSLLRKWVEQVCA